MLRLITLGGLSIESEGQKTGGGPRPRRLALLAVLAGGGAKGLSRDRVLAILWPESEPDRARHALSQTLYSLKNDLGADVVVAAAELRLDTARISSDVDDFRAAVAAKDWARAAQAYTGPFLDGFYLTDAPEFERWVEEERTRLAHDGARAIERYAQEAAAAGLAEVAAEQWRRLTVLDPLHGGYAASYMSALVGRGDRGGALAHGKEHAELVRRELESEPDAGVGQLMGTLRGRGERWSVTEVADRELAAGTTDHADQTGTTDHADQTDYADRARRSVRGLRAAGIVLSVVFIAGLLVTARNRFAGSGGTAGAAANAPVLAVGRIQDLVTPDSARLGGVLSEMLATSLGRLTDLQVIANSRILELVPRDADTDRSARTAAAKRAGATEVLEGELIPLPDGRLRLELRRVEIERGLLRGGYQLNGADRMTLFDSVTVLIAADFRVAAPTGTLAEVSTRSPLAYRLYEEGLRAFYQFDSYAANRLFLDAVREDSTFAMAAYYAWQSARAVHAANQDALADRAVALAARASERDRLLILTHVGYARYDLRSAAAADSLVARYPNDPEALMRGADVVRDFARAVILLNRSIALDSAAGVGPTAVCRLCDALNALMARYAAADSVAAALRTLDRWSRIRPADHKPWMLRADYLVGVAPRAAADAALRRADSLGAPTGDRPLQQLAWNLRADDLGRADEICRRALASADLEEFSRYRGLCTIALRMAGRDREALALAIEARAPGATSPRRGAGADRHHAAILDMEMGRPLAAAARFAAMANEAAEASRLTAAVRARSVAWFLTLSATALAAGGDTIRVRALLDSVEATGRRSLFPRDPLLHHFLRGLLYASAGQHEDAVREFRAAIASPSDGYTRINYELAGSLLALKRPLEAVTILRSALHGELEGSALYLTRTAVHERLARAFEGAGMTDSAAVHSAIVDRARRGADGERKVEGGRRMAEGGWRMAEGGWRMVDGRWRK